MIQPKVRRQCFVDTPDLLGVEMTASASESLRVDRADLFDENSRGLALDLDLGSEGGGTRSSPCGRDDHDGSWQELIGRHDDGEAIAVLFRPQRWTTNLCVQTHPTLRPMV